MLRYIILFFSNTDECCGILFFSNTDRIVKRLTIKCFRSRMSGSPPKRPRLDIEISSDHDVSGSESESESEMMSRCTECTPAFYGLRCTSIECNCPQLLRRGDKPRTQMYPRIMHDKMSKEEREREEARKVKLCKRFVAEKKVERLECQAAKTAKKIVENVSHRRRGEIWSLISNNAKRAINMH